MFIGIPADQCGGVAPTVSRTLTVGRVVTGKSVVPGSGGVPVFVDEAVASVVSEHGDGGRRGFGWVFGWFRRSLVEGLVWSVVVVVGDVVASESFELSAVPDDGAIEKLAAPANDRRIA